MIIDNGLMPLHHTIDEVDEMPDVLRNVFPRLKNEIVDLSKALVKRDIDKILIMGNGDSYFCAQMVKYAFEKYTNINTQSIQGFEFALYGFPNIDQRTAIFVISSSGRFSKARDTLIKARETQAFIVGITDSIFDENPFINNVHTSIIPGARKKGWPTQTTMATAVTLLHLALEIGVRKKVLTDNEYQEFLGQLTLIPSTIQQVITGNKSKLEKFAKENVECPVFTFMGSGPGVGVANLGSALMAESAQRPAVSFEIEEYHHSLRFATLSSSNMPILVANQELSYPRFLETSESIKNWGAPLVSIIFEGEEKLNALSDWSFVVPKLADTFSGLLSLPVLQQMSIELTKERLHKGHVRPAEVP